MIAALPHAARAAKRVGPPDVHKRRHARAGRRVERPDALDRHAVQDAQLLVARRRPVKVCGEGAGRRAVRHRQVVDEHQVADAVRVLDRVSVEQRVERAEQLPELGRLEEAVASRRDALVRGGRADDPQIRARGAGVAESKSS